MRKATKVDPRDAQVLIISYGSYAYHGSCMCDIPVELLSIPFPFLGSMKGLYINTIGRADWVSPQNT